MEIQQSSLYKMYIQSLGWQVVSLDGSNVFIRRFPFVGSLAKIHRPTKLPNLTKLVPVLKQYNVRTLAVEPDRRVAQIQLRAWCKRIGRHVRLNGMPFLPTKTMYINLSPSGQAIFDKFSEAKRRAVRRSIKNNVTVKESTNIDDLIRVKNKSAGMFGFITTYGIKKLWNIFAPKHAAILLAYSSPNETVGGVLLLFWKDTAYYWIAGATKKGKKLFAPTLLVWEALKLAKNRGAKQFDFVGVWDERIPNKFHEWKGFTKFKEGFGGAAQYYTLT